MRGIIKNCIHTVIYDQHDYLPNTQEKYIFQKTERRESGYTSLITGYLNILCILSYYYIIYLSFFKFKSVPITAKNILCMLNLRMKIKFMFKAKLLFLVKRFTLEVTNLFFFYFSTVQRFHDYQYQRFFFNFTLLIYICTIYYNLISNLIVPNNIEEYVFYKFLVVY